MKPRRVDTFKRVTDAYGRVWPPHFKWGLTVPNPPQKHVLQTARDIRRRFGAGGANFPGAEELYEAARKIEMWAEEWEPE